MRGPTQIAIGDVVVLRHRKHDGTPHWVIPTQFLGQDAHGYWLVRPKGSFISRPGAAAVSASAVLHLVPHEGDYVVEFFDDHHPGDFRVYSDIVAKLAWQELQPTGWEVTSIHMDLDVVQSTTRGLYVDDEDEFAAHQDLLAYSPALIAQTAAEADRVMSLLQADEGPFDGSAQLWFAEYYRRSAAETD